MAGRLLPDILSYDPKRPACFPDNGRTLTDDAVDVFLPILTNGKVTGDKVGPHSDLLGEFPYLGPPHKADSADLLDGLGELRLVEIEQLDLEAQSGTRRDIRR